MSRKFIRFVAILAILIIAFGTGGVARAEPTSQKPAALSSVSAATSPWFTGWADKNTSANVGSYPSIAYNPVNGLPYISYYDSVNGNLMLASPVTSGGNCGVKNLWNCRVVDGDDTANGKTEGDVGQYSSIAFYKPSGISSFRWKLGISYYDSKNNALKLAVWTQGVTISGWTYMTIMSKTSNSDVVGTYTSLKFASDGTPRIAYYRFWYNLQWMGALFLARPAAIAGVGNCGPGNDWRCDYVLGDTGMGSGYYASLGIGYDDEIYVAYYNAMNGNLDFAFYAGPTLGDCGYNNTYTCWTIDGINTDNDGMFAALTAPRSSTDKVRIAYYDTNGYLKYATQVSSGSGNCGGGDWQCDVIHTMGNGLAQAGISMALDQNGDPIIAYEDATDDQAPATLSIARPATAVNKLGVGNCGPIVMYHTWQCDTIDNAAYGSGYVNLAAYTSVAVSSSGLATIAYYEDNSFYNTDYLKVANQRFLAFLPLIRK